MTTAPLPGSAVITNTTLVKASELLEDPKSLLSPLEAIFDLCGLIDAAVLRPELLTLEGDLLGKEGAYANATLPSTLRAEGILRDGAVPLDREDVQRALAVIVGSETIFSRINVRGISLSIPNMLPEIFPEEAHSFSTPGFPEGERHCFMMLARHRDPDVELVHSPNVIDFFRSDDFQEYLRGTGDELRGAYALRTFLYGRAAWKSHLDFIPDYPRIPFLESLVDKVYRCVVGDAHELVAQRLRAEAADFLESASPLGLPLPPFASILFTRCSTRDDIVPELLHLRHEFSSLRDNLVSFEKTRISATTIKESNAARRHVQDAFAATTKKFVSDSYQVFKGVLDYVGEAGEAALDWSNPAAYRTSLLTKPYEWLRDWWRRRPLVQFFQAAREFRRIEDYNLLLHRLFDIDITAEDQQAFHRALQRLERAFRSEERSP